MKQWLTVLCACASVSLFSPLFQHCAAAEQAAVHSSWNELQRYITAPPAICPVGTVRSAAEPVPHDSDTGGQAASAKRLVSKPVSLSRPGTLVRRSFAKPNSLEIRPNQRDLTVQLRVPIRDGRVSLRDVARVVSRYHGYDDSELNALLPAGSVPVNTKVTHGFIATLNRVMRPCVVCSVEGQTGQSQVLRITVDRESAQQWVNRQKAAVRAGFELLEWDKDTSDFGICFLDPPNQVSNADIVVLVHGLNSHPEDLAGLVPTARGRQRTVATFRYPNDQPIADSARLLASELRQLRRRYPLRRVRLLTHSMGGLVARRVLETHWDPGNVRQLIMIGPPNHGSGLARVASFMDCYEFLVSSGRRCGVMAQAVADGLGEATADLCPNSVFLDHLNAQPRNPAVRYTLLLGTGGPVPPAEARRLRHGVRDYTDDSTLVRFLTSKIVRTLDELDEVVQGKGDGAVSCERGRLTGVHDVVTLPFSHAGVLGRSSPAARQAHAIIRQRLALSL